MESERYLIWSCEHHSWWGPDGTGFSKSIDGAGQYDQAFAVALCRNAIPLNADRLGYWPLLPVPMHDATSMATATKMMPFNFYRQPGKATATTKEWEVWRIPNSILLAYMGINGDLYGLGQRARDGGKHENTAFARAAIVVPRPRSVSEEEERKLARMLCGEAWFE
jgi:hypothetical protein